MLRRAIKMLRKIATYDVLNIPRGMMKSLDKAISFCLNSDNNKSNVIFMSLIYIGGIVVMAILMIRIAIFDWSLALIGYMACIIVNLWILSMYKHVLYLSKDWDSPFPIFLFIFAGPFGILRIAYLLICLKIMTIMDEEYHVILKIRPDRWRQVIDGENPSLFINSIRKYRKRLKEYS